MAITSDWSTCSSCPMWQHDGNYPCILYNVKKSLLGVELEVVLHHCCRRSCVHRVHKILSFRSSFYCFPIQDHCCFFILFWFLQKNFSMNMMYSYVPLLRMKHNNVPFMGYDLDKGQNRLGWQGITEPTNVPGKSICTWDCEHFYS